MAGLLAHIGFRYFLKEYLYFCISALGVIQFFDHLPTSTKKILNLDKNEYISIYDPEVLMKILFVFL